MFVQDGSIDRQASLHPVRISTLTLQVVGSPVHGAILRKSNLIHCHKSLFSHFLFRSGSCAHHRLTVHSSEAPLQSASLS
jgi:hypothetical protein